VLVLVFLDALGLGTLVGIVLSSTFFAFRDSGLVFNEVLCRAIVCLSRSFKVCILGMRLYFGFAATAGRDCGDIAVLRPLLFGDIRVT